MRILLSTLLLGTICFTALHSFGKPHSISQSETLIVVHPTNYFANNEAQDSINSYVNRYLDSKKLVLVLVETEKQKREILTKIGNTKSKPDQSKPSSDNYLYFLKRIRETKMIISNHGENQISLPSPKVTIIGGYLEACLRTALRSLIKRNIKNHKTLNFYIPMEALYGKDSFKKKGNSIQDSIKASAKKEPPSHITISIYIDNEEFLTRGTGEKQVNIFIEKGKRKRIDSRRPSSRASSL